MKKLFALLLAVLIVSSFSLTAFAATADDATIDDTQTGSISIYKYDITNAEKDGVWDSSYVSTGVRDASGVEAVLGDPTRVSALNANGSAYGYAVRGVEFSYLKVADIRSYIESDTARTGRGRTFRRRATGSPAPARSPTVSKPTRTRPTAAATPP